MDHYRDPDYESYNSAVELNEEEDKKENLNKITKIIEDEYNNEITHRKDQIEKIELQICKVRKVLHLLRYALIMSYYKKKELEYNGTEDEASTSDSLIVPDKQNRIHPAVKKLLGKNVHNLDHLTITDKRKSTVRNTSQNVTPSDDLPDSKRIKLEVDALETSEKTVPITTTDCENNLDLIRNRKKTQHRIIVGNISKWMPSSEDDILTHKWMVYVRGPKNKPDVSRFVEKVVYYLHPSYKPHDVVEVCESPFHLSRRGWGEFPVRVQIFFKVTLNKPINIHHDIKLDKTYSGKQMLGNETVVDVFLYDDNNSNNEPEVNKISEKIEFPSIKNEEIDIKMEECESEVITEHDYCYETNEETPDYEITYDHCYTLPSSHEGLPKPKKEKIQQDETIKLIYGLDSYYEDTEKYKIPTNIFKQLIQMNRKDIKLNNTKIIVFDKKIEGSFLTFGKLTQTPTRDVKLEGRNIKITLPKNRMKNVGEALPYLFKKLPLFSELANNANYKRTYPFTAATLKEYVGWNVGKKRSSEWSRAKIIRRILITENIQGIENWNTKAVLMYGRSHDYTPYISYGLFNRDSEEKELLMCCYDSQNERNYKKFSVNNPDIIVNVESDSEEPSPKKIDAAIDITNPHTKMECSFIKQAALDVGIMLNPEEIIEGVQVNGAEMMILEAVKSLAENLIRRAKNHRVCTKPQCPSSSPIDKEDVKVAINERPELSCLRRNEYFLSTDYL